jgi:hypothetical protein
MRWAPAARALLLPLLLLLLAAAGGGVRAQDWSAVRTDISTLLRADLRLATAALRLGFHACGTFDASASTGGCLCAAALNASDTANLGLAAVATQLRAVAAAHAGASVADVFTLGSVVAVSELRGPTIPWRAGRTDAPCAPPPDAEALLPDAMSDGLATPSTPPRDGAPTDATAFAPAAMRAVFTRMGLSDGATVALLGAHTVGHCHHDRSGFFGAWTSTPFQFSNEFFVNFASTPPNDLSAAGAAQFMGAWRANALTAPATGGSVTQFRDGPFRALTGAEAGLVPTAPITSTAYTQPLLTIPGGGPGGAQRRNEYMRLPTDMALIADDAYRAFVRRYADGSPTVGTAAAPTAGSVAFFADFVTAMQALLELGVPSAQLSAVTFSAAAMAAAPPAVAPPPAPEAAGGARRMPATHAALLGAGAAAFALAGGGGGCPFVL